MKTNACLLALLILLPPLGAETRAGAAGGAAEDRLPGSRVSLRTPGVQPDDPSPADATKDQVPVFRTPADAVAAFLTALKDKDPVRLREATSARAPIETGPKNRSLFTAILEQTLAEDKLTELAAQLEGFQIVAQHPMQTGRVLVYVVKPGPNDSEIVREISARWQNKKGWKVLDISEPTERKKKTSRGRRPAYRSITG